MMRHILLAAMAATLSSALPVSAASPHDAVVIEGAADDFIVTAGATALGCSAGTRYFAHGSLPPGMRGAFVMVMTCTVGGAGTITINFQPANGIPGPDGDNNVGHWNVTDASGDFIGLGGRGDFTYFLPPAEGDTFVGFIHY